MRLKFRTKRSAGVRVEARVHRLITQGDTARDAQDWSVAAASYGDALAIDSRLAHIHVQYGHVLREAGRVADADAAYAAGARANPSHGDAWVSRARLSAQTGNVPGAVVYLTDLLRRMRGHLEARDMLAQVLDAGHPVPLADALRAMNERPLIRDSRPEPAAGSDGSVSPIVFDITDLISHFRHHRLPNGIQRVQMEVLSTLLAERASASVLACCFVSGREGWIEVPLRLCRELTTLAGGGTDMNEPLWREARSRLFIHLAMAPDYQLPFRATLVNLGTSFWVHDYFRFIRNAKEKRQIRYVPLVYDMIPIVKPELCVIGWRRDFTIWLVGLFQHADGYLAISQSAKRDLLRVAEELGHDVPADRVEVVPLDADFRRAHPMVSVSVDTAYESDAAPFALMVATIEPRKNHVLVLEAWSELIRRHGASVVPRLICVGRDGWMNDEVFDLLDGDPVLAAKVTLAYNTSDCELVQLYRDSLFTVFPSLYEGWGLPVTESLCHGRLPIVADNSALREAGASFALFFKDASRDSLVEALEIAAFDHAWRATQEAAITGHFRARAWRDIASQIESAAHRLASCSGSRNPINTVVRGLYYPVNLYTGLAIHHGLVSGEAFRMGEGWLWPTPQGSRTRPDGGDIRMRIASADGVALRLFLHVRGLATRDCVVHISTNQSEICRATLRQNKARWLTCDIPPGIGNDLALHVQGEVSEYIETSPNNRVRQASVEVLGFFLTDRDDTAAQAEFVRARRTSLNALSVYRGI